MQGDYQVREKTWSQHFWFYGFMFIIGVSVLIANILWMTVRLVLGYTNQKSPGLEETKYNTSNKIWKYCSSLSDRDNKWILEACIWTNLIWSILRKTWLGFLTIFKKWAFKGQGPFAVKRYHDHENFYKGKDFTRTYLQFERFSLLLSY